MRIQFYITINKLFSRNNCSEQYIFDCRVSMKLMRKSVLILAIAPLVFLIAACGGESAQTANTASTPAAPATRNRWDSIKSCGQLICGVSGEMPGFSFVGTDGKYSSIDVDVCCAIVRIKTRVNNAASDFSPSFAGNNSTVDESIS